MGVERGPGAAHRRAIGRAVRARARSIAASSNTSRPGSPNAATATMTRGRCRNMWSASFAAIWSAASSPTALPGRGAACGHDFLIAFSCKGAACAHRATPAHGGDGGASHRSRLAGCRCGSGYWRCPSACATSWNATPIQGAACTCSCARWSNACARTARVQSRGASRRGGLHPPLRLHPQCPPALPLRGHRRRVRPRHRGRGRLPCRDRARCQRHRAGAGAGAPAAVARFRALRPAAA